MSYLNDPLRDIARLAAFLLEDREVRRALYHRQPLTVVFQEEPGGILLRVLTEADATAEDDLLFEISTCQDVTDNDFGEVLPRRR